MELAIGFTNKYYTIWKVEAEPIYYDGLLKGHNVKQYYLKNLSMDLDKAIEKAKSMGCKNLTPDSDLKGTTYREYFKESKEEKLRRLELEKSKMKLESVQFTFGKYSGKTYEEVSRFDPDYLNWAYYNGNSSVKSGIESTELWKEKERSFQENQNRKKQLIQKAKESGSIVLTIETNPDSFPPHYSETEEGIDLHFESVKISYYNGYEYALPMIKGKGKRVKGKTFKVIVDKNDTNDDRLVCLDIKKV